jgi:hypothetical protein
VWLWKWLLWLRKWLILAARVKLYSGVGHGCHHGKEGKGEEDLHDIFLLIISCLALMFFL